MSSDALSFIEVHTITGMEQLVNVSAIEEVRQLAKCRQLVLAHDPLEVVETYEELKQLLAKAAEGEATAVKPCHEGLGFTQTQ